MSDYREISANDDVFDIRDAIAEFEALEDTEDMRPEIAELLDEVKGCGGDEQWRGDWYPVTFIRDSYFVDYAQELAEELDLIPAGAQWPAYCIDWERAARELRVDYSSVEFDGVTYWYR